MRAILVLLALVACSEPEPCIRWESQTHLHPMLIGKMIIIMPMTYRVFVERAA